MNIAHRRLPGRIFWVFPLMAFVVATSLLSVHFWGHKPERLSVPKELILTEDMTPRRIAEQNRIPEKVVRKALGLRSDADWEQSLRQRRLPVATARRRLRKTLAIAAEAGAKNWRKIWLKFALWFLVVAIAWWMLRRKKMTPRRRWTFYLLSLTLFGVVLGADPSPMGTVKDAIILWAEERVWFGPRMIALAAFLAMVVLFNKSICGWGCQVGTLQDLIFSLNRNARDRKGLIRQWKPPFWLTNGIRVLFFAALVSVALAWSLDIIAPIDPFKVFKPTHLGWIGGTFLAVLLTASLFVYRPWCTFFCPFGLVGWIFEKLAVFKIRVDRSTCIACEACHKACPSTVMEAILKQEHPVLPDCFACGRCIDACPTGSVTLSLGRREGLGLSWSEFQKQAKHRVKDRTRDGDAPVERDQADGNG